MLIVLGGLPASGKSTIAAILAQTLPAIHLRIDTVEQACRRAGFEVKGPEGYEISGQVAADNLRLGHTVIADSVNPVAWTRSYWRSVAEGVGAAIAEVEIVCTDPTVHRRRAETREADIEGHRLPDWRQILKREYEPWQGAFVVDTANQTAEACAGRIRDQLSQIRRNTAP